MRERPSQWIASARRVVLEARRGNAVQRLEIAPYGTGQKVSWQVGGSDRTFDAAAQQWRDRMLETLDTTWEISSLRGQVSSLRGEISSLRGEESSLPRRDLVAAGGDQLHARAAVVAAWRGEQPARRDLLDPGASQLAARRDFVRAGQHLEPDGRRVWDSDSSRTRDAVKRHEAEIARLEREIVDYNAGAKVAAVERRIDALATDTKTGAIEADIKNFDLNGKIAAIEKKIAALDVDGKSAAIERQITALDVDRRVRQLEDRRDQELKRLDAAISAIR